MGTNVRQNIVTNGLALYLDAGNRQSYVSGSIVSGSYLWNDISGNGRNGTLINGPSFDINNQGSLVFDGLNDYISFASQTQFQTPTFTICSVVNPITFDVNGTVIFTRETSRLNLGIYYGATKGAYFFVRGSNYVSPTGPELNGIQQSYPFEAGTWYHLTYIVDIPGNNYKMYVNGLQIWSSNIALGTNFLSPSTTDGVIAARYGGGSNYTNIEIATFHFYNRVLSAQEVAQNYNAIKTRFGLS
jgi:hypothetical protein